MDGISFTFTPSSLQEIRNVQVQFTVADNNFPQNWVYYIANVNRSHDGVYIAHVSCKLILSRHFEVHAYKYSYHPQVGENTEPSERQILLQVTSETSSS